MTDGAILRAAIAASGLSVRHFAKAIGRSPRVVWAWKARGEVLTLPRAARDACLREMGKECARIFIQSARDS